MLQVDRIERLVLAERQVAATLLAAGAKNVTMPVLQDALDEFDAQLVAPPVVVDRHKLRLMRVLGVAS